jgi:transcriptional regulator with XRE-family HTH domain
MVRLNLEDARRLLGWSAAKLAEESGVKASAIYDIEQGRVRNPAYSTVMLITRAFQQGGMPGLTADDIFPVPSEAKAS